jgi:SAM-dependent methyltransferase
MHGHQHPSAGSSEGAPSDSPDGIWLAATWPFIRGQLPAPPARVIELGCGRFGGHVPALIRAGYDATGVDPEAPLGAAYRRAAFEDCRPESPADAVIASVSLHHVDDPGVALDHVAEVLRPDGALIVIEWISEDFDEATAQWCFGHQPREPDGWLAGLHERWAESGLSWDAFFGGELAEHGLHPAGVIRQELDARFTATHLSTGPYYFSELLDADAAAEQAAIDAGQIRAGCLRYAGRRAGGGARGAARGGRRAGAARPGGLGARSGTRVIRIRGSPVRRRQWLRLVSWSIDGGPGAYCAAWCVFRNFPWWIRALRRIGGTGMHRIHHAARIYHAIVTRVGIGASEARWVRGRGRERWDAGPRSRG